MMWHGGWSGADWVLMGLVMLVFWTLVITGVLWLIGTRRRPNSSDTASRQSDSGAAT